MLKVGLVTITDTSLRNGLCWLIAGCLLVALGGCQFPRLHRVTIQQGNVISQDMVNQLQPGMTRSQVAYIMGEPILKNPFDSDKWDYLYSVELPGYYEQKYRMTVYFENDKLAYFTGDLKPQTAAQIAAEKEKRATAAAEAEKLRQEARDKAKAAEDKKNRRKRKKEQTG